MSALRSDEAKNMTLALNTTKRKFHKILDSITNSSTAAPSPNQGGNASMITLPTNTEPPAKRSRVSRSISAYVPRAAKHTSSPSKTPKVVGMPLSGTTVLGERKAPNFAPWDRDQFLTRIKTFRHVDKWMSKPERVSEVQWAKRGWTCVGKERVGCVGGCGKELVIKLEGSEKESDDTEGSLQEDEDWRVNAQNQLVEKYSQLIVTAHDEGCLWRKRGCDETIYRLPLTHPQITLDAFRARYESLAQMSADLPTSISMPTNSDLTDAIERIAPIVNSRSAPVYDEDIRAANSVRSIHQNAIILALFGWRSEEGHISGLATCEACFRRLGLWLFIAKKISADTGLDGEEKGASISKLDVIEEHRDYCPWVNASSQSGGGTLREGAPALPYLTGWETLLRVIRNAQYSREVTLPPVMATSNAENENIGEDGRSDVISIANKMGEPEDRAARDVKDKERWAKLKKLKRVFHVKDIKKVAKG